MIIRRKNKLDLGQMNLNIPFPLYIAGIRWDEDKAYLQNKIRKEIFHIYSKEEEYLRKHLRYVRIGESLRKHFRSLLKFPFWSYSEENTWWLLRKTPLFID